MKRKGTLVHAWRGLTPAGYPIRVEEHRYDLSYIVEFFDGDAIDDKKHCLTHCPVSGELLTTTLLRGEVEAYRFASGRI